jgi:hypothetical protein
VANEKAGWARRAQFVSLGRWGRRGWRFFFGVGSLCYYSQCVPTWFPSSSHNVLQDVPTSSKLLSHILWSKIELFIYISERPKGGISSASIRGVINVFFKKICDNPINMAPSPKKIKIK